MNAVLRCGYQIGVAGDPEAGVQLCGELIPHARLIHALGYDAA